jgi:hypothetical protein
MRLQADFLRSLMLHVKDAMGVLLMPQFAYKPAELWLAEQMVMTMLMERKLVAHRKWGLVFQEQVDARDKRSLVYDGRWMLSTEGETDKDYLWAQAKILRGRTDIAKQLAAKHMQVVEELGEEVLPSTTDRFNTVKGAHKYSQCGEDAMQKMLDAVMEGPDWGKHQGNTVVVLVDLNPGVADLMDAFVLRRSAMRIPMHYVGLVDNDSHEEWVKQVKGRALIDKHASGELQVVGHPKPATDLPSELLEVLPASPVLNKLVIVDDKLMAPKDLEETWSANPKFQKQFAEMIDAVALELGDSWTKWDALPPSQPANTNTPMKRPGDDLAALSPPKKAKVGEDKVIEEGKMVGGEDLFCTQILGGKSYVDVFLVIKPSHHIYIVDRSTKPVELPDGFLLAGFGKGSLKFLSKEPDANPDTHITLSLEGSDTNVLLDNKMRTLKDVIEEKRKTDPSPKVMYHNLEDVPGGGVGAFRLVVVHEVLFGLLEQEVPKDGKDSKDNMLINRIGALIPTNFWKSHCLDIIWAMRWVPTGLQPVRPVCCLTQGVALPPGHALVCN